MSTTPDYRASVRCPDCGRSLPRLGTPHSFCPDPEMAQRAFDDEVVERLAPTLTQQLDGALKAADWTTVHPDRLARRLLRDVLAGLRDLEWSPGMRSPSGDSDASQEQPVTTYAPVADANASSKETS